MRKTIIYNMCVFSPVFNYHCLHCVTSTHLHSLNSCVEPMRLLCGGGWSIHLSASFPAGHHTDYMIVPIRKSYKMIQFTPQIYVIMIVSNVLIYWTKLISKSINYVAAYIYFFFFSKPHPTGYFCLTQYS